MEEMISAHFGVGKNGPWTESVVVVKPGASDKEIEAAANTAKALAAQFSGEVEQAKQDSQSLAARFVLERMEPREIHDRMDEDFAGSCRMPIGKFGDVLFPGKTVAEVYDECPKAVHWVGFDKAVEWLRDAGADKKLGIIACGVYWNAVEGVKTGLKPVVKPKEEELERRQPSFDGTQPGISDNTDYDEPKRDLTDPGGDYDDWI